MHLAMYMSDSGWGEISSLEQISFFVETLEFSGGQHKHRYELLSSPQILPRSNEKEVTLVTVNNKYGFSSH